MQIAIFTNESFANNADYSLQIGFVIITTDKDEKANILY